MSNPGTEGTPEPFTTEEMHAALFAQLVMQQANLALMLMGKTPNPQGGETVKDTDSARLLIDQLQMLEAKTKGNLTKEEAALLKQTLMTLQFAFVEAVEAPPAPAAKPKPAPAPAPAENPAPAGTPAEDEGRKKFSKKY